MNKAVGIFLIFISVLFCAQKPTEKTLAEIDRISLENPDSAIVLINRIESQLQNTNFKSRLLLSKGNAFSLKHLSSESLNSGFEAYEIAGKAKDSLMMINSLSFIGNQYYIIKMNSEALNYLTKAEKLIDRISGNKQLNYINANIFFVKGLIYKDKLDPNFALEYFNKAIDNYKKTDSEKSSYNMLITLIQKAYSLGDLNRVGEARKILELTIISSEKNNLKEVGNYAKIALATIATKSGDYEESNKILLEVEQKLDQKENSLMLLEIDEAMTSNYFLTKDLENYKVYSQKYEKSLLENEMKEAKSISDISVVNNNLIEKEKKESYRYFLLFLLIFIPLTGIAIYYLIRSTVVFRKNVLLSKTHRN